MITSGVEFSYIGEKASLNQMHSFSFVWKKIYLPQKLGDPLSILMFLIIRSLTLQSRMEPDLKAFVIVANKFRTFQDNIVKSSFSQHPLFTCIGSAQRSVWKIHNVRKLWFIWFALCITLLKHTISSFFGIGFSL